MDERGLRHYGGTPFYAPRRKTSAEIISEARAAISSEMNNTMGTVRPLRTRRPFTPREPQRTLFTERTVKKDQRPPSAFDLKHLTLSENSEDAVVKSGSKYSAEEDVSDTISNEITRTMKKHSVKSRRERAVDGWGGFPKLPHLSGRSKPLHRRNTTEQSDDALSPDSSHKKKYFASSNSLSCDTFSGHLDVTVKHLAGSRPKSKNDDYDNMTLLELAEALLQKNVNTDTVLYIMTSLQNNIEKTLPSKSLKELVLRALYRHIDSDDERVLVAIARAMFTMRLAGTHLAAASKLIFKVARNDKNDHFFINSNLLDLLIEGSGRIEPLSESECCVYAAGALRFLALEPRLRKLARRAGALHLAALHLKIFNNAKAERPRQMSEQATHALYQVTGALRNLATIDDEGDKAKGEGGERDVEGGDFVSSGALSELLIALTLHTDRDVLTNVARCLSVLSVRRACCTWLCGEPTSAGAVLRALAACASRAPLALRLAYTLGNMAAADHLARVHIYNEEGGVDVLLTILESYTQRSDCDRDAEADPDLHLVGSDLGGSDGSNEDVLIKTVRVIANLCLAEYAGRGLADHHADRTIRNLLACLVVADKPTDNKLKSLPGTEQIECFERREELATAVLATLNNITFYLEPSESYSHSKTFELLCKATCKWIKSTSNAACEAIRALGNLSRSRLAAQVIVLEGALDVLPAFLQHEDPSVRCAAAGVLVNVCGAGGIGGTEGGDVGGSGGVGNIGGAAEAAARAICEAARAHDAQCAALLARALWNALAYAPLEPSHARSVAAALTMFMDDDTIFTACEAANYGEGRGSDPDMSNIHVKFETSNQNYYPESKNHFVVGEPNLGAKAFSVEEDLHLLEGEYVEDGERCSGEDLGFEEGEVEECECGSCSRLAAWEQLMGVAIPLLEKLRPHRTDASVGTD